MSKANAYRMNQSGNPTTIVMETRRGPVEIHSGPAQVSRNPAGMLPGMASVLWGRKTTSFTSHRDAAKYAAMMNMMGYATRIRMQDQNQPTEIQAQAGVIAGENPKQLPTTEHNRVQDLLIEFLGLPRAIALLIQTGDLPDEDISQTILREDGPMRAAWEWMEQNPRERELIAQGEPLWNFPGVPVETNDPLSEERMRFLAAHGPDSYRREASLMEEYRKAQNRFARGEGTRPPLPHVCRCWGI